MKEKRVGIEIDGSSRVRISNTTFGPDIDTLIKITPDEYEEERLIYEDYNAGLSASAIAAKHNLDIDDVLEILDFIKGK